MNKSNNTKIGATIAVITILSGSLLITIMVASSGDMDEKLGILAAVLLFIMGVMVGILASQFKK